MYGRSLFELEWRFCRYDLRKVLNIGQNAEHFEQQVGGSQRGDSGRVVDGCDLHQVAPDQVQGSTASNDLQSLGGRDPADLGGSGPRASRGVDGVYVEGEVDGGRRAHLRPDLLHQGRQRFVPQFLNLLQSLIIELRKVSAVRITTVRIKLKSKTGWLN